MRPFNLKWLLGAGDGSCHSSIREEFPIFEYLSAVHLAEAAVINGLKGKLHLIDDILIVKHAVELQENSGFDSTEQTNLMLIVAIITRADMPMLLLQ